MAFVSIPEGIEEIRAGGILAAVDDEDREDEGALTIAAEKVTPEIINFIATHRRGLICLTPTPERCDYLRLPLMTPHNTSIPERRSGGVRRRGGTVGRAVSTQPARGRKRGGSRAGEGLE